MAAPLAGQITRASDIPSGLWVAWTPVLTAVTTPPTLGVGGTATGRYCVIGGTVFFTYAIAFGSSGVAAGSGFYSVAGLPVAVGGSAVVAGQCPFTAQDSSTGQYLTGVGELGPGNTSVIRLRFGDSGTTTTTTTIGNAVPWTWAAGDRLYGSGLYES